MRLKALSHYNGDTDTRFGDCIMISNSTQLIVYDCGHKKHVEAVGDFLRNNTSVKEVHIVVSHNDSDHTDGIIPLIDYLASEGYETTVYTSLYLKHASKVEKLLDDGRRSKKSICDHILEIFNNIAEIVEKAQEYGFSVKNASKGVTLATAQIVGPLEDEFVEVVATAIEEDGTGTINGETVMNAASVQLKFCLDNQNIVLLCGDAAPQYLKNLDSYDIIQFPHHGQYQDGVAILDCLGDASYSKKYLISDNTGSGKTSGGSAELVDYMKEENYEAAFNTLNGVVSLPVKLASSSTSSKGVRLGVFFT
ncbi:hypothetical protein BHF70_09000 [Anaerostipes sp. 494a]|uniref:hypothetical protein n=1 Tax=Anaerostipes sp. 494a TaxID=1261636 RepID=UPI0009523FA4|nr:hypothetical protein [Anaerostipes sp. 494a]OLR59735.1 hypothetical protein BHF70_09000 [Anaerostipes sp. 494a]